MKCLAEKMSCGGWDIMRVKIRFLLSLAFAAVLTTACRRELVQPKVEFRHLPEENCWIVRHKSVSRTYEQGPDAGRTIRFPVFNGTNQEVDYESLYANIPKPDVGPREVQFYCVVVPAGQVKKTVESIIDFYSQHILKGVDILHPKFIGECRLQDNGSCPMRTSLVEGFTYYGITVDGVPDHSFNITFPVIPNQSVVVRTIWDIPIAEKGGWKSEQNSKTRKDAIIKWWLGS